MAARENGDSRIGGARGAAREPSARVCWAAIFSAAALVILLSLAFWAYSLGDGAVVARADAILSSSGAINAWINAALSGAAALLSGHISLPAGFPPKLGVSGYELVIWALVVIFVLWSAFWSADLAEMRGNSRLGYFILGIILPFIYPGCVCARRLRELRALQGAMRARAAEALKAADLARARKRSETLVSASDIPDAPFVIETIDGDKLEVAAALEINEQYIEAEIAAAAGERKRVRMPFSKIKSVSKWA